MWQNCLQWKPRLKVSLLQGIISSAFFGFNWHNFNFSLICPCFPKAHTFWNASLLNHFDIFLVPFSTWKQVLCLFLWSIVSTQIEWFPLLCALLIYVDPLWQENVQSCGSDSLLIGVINVKKRQWDPGGHRWSCHRDRGKHLEFLVSDLLLES